MLVLTRQVGEEIVIGDSVRVKILALKYDRVKVGITAPKQVPVHREEVSQRLKEFQKTAPAEFRQGSKPCQTIS